MRPRQVWTRERLTADLRKRAKADPLWFRHLRRDHRGLLRAAERLYGRWSAALKAAGIPRYWKGDNPGPAIYTRENVLEILRRAWAKGDVRIDPLKRRHAGIYRAALRYFWTWQRALAAAGVPPGERRRRGQRPKHGANLPRTSDRRSNGVRST